MPLNIAKLGRLRRTDSVARAVYDLENASPARVKAATEALERANPRLAAGEELKGDEYIVVPPVEKVALDVERNRELRVGRESYIDVIGERIGALVAAPALDPRKAAKRAELQLKMLGDKTLTKQLATEYPELEKELDALRKSARETIASRQAEAERLATALEAMRSEQDAAFAKMGITPPPSS
jgi:hypothetical protein